jgi:hypothetical protein
MEGNLMNELEQEDEDYSEDEDEPDEIGKRDIPLFKEDL